MIKPEDLEASDRHFVEQVMLSIRMLRGEIGQGDGGDARMQRAYALVLMREALGVLDSIRQVAVEHNLEQLVDYLGACERIHKTPLPFAYVIHLRRALLLYALSLPFVLVESFGWGTIAATFAISYIMFGIEEIGVEIEDPFGYDDNDLPLEQICEGIEKRLLNDV